MRRSSGVILEGFVFEQVELASKGSPHRYFWLHTRKGRIIKEMSDVMKKKGLPKS
jgi:hypothetical protein